MNISYERRKGDNPFKGLFSDPLTIVGEVEYRKQWIVNELIGLMEEQGISRVELAKRIGVQPSRVTSMLTGTNNFTIESLVRAGRAVGADVEIHFVPMSNRAKEMKPDGQSKSASTKVAEDATTYSRKVRRGRNEIGN